MNCQTCKRELNTADPSTMDCGGDCLRCMADAGDPSCIASMYEILKARCNTQSAALSGIASCATRCGCCEMHKRVAQRALGVAPSEAPL